MGQFKNLMVEAQEKLEAKLGHAPTEQEIIDEVLAMTEAIMAAKEDR